MSIALFGNFSADAGNRVNDFFQTVDLGPLAVIDILIVAGIFYWLYKILKETRALGIIYGILILVVFFLLAKLAKLELLAFLFANFLTLLFVAIPVLFQPELRRALERLGRTPRWSRFRPKSGDATSRVVKPVADAVTVLSQNRAGAIIVLKRTTGLADLATGGTELDAKVSAALLLNLFYERSPLHDGAVIIDGDRIVAAGTMLPLSEQEYGYTLGARHRASIGLTEQCDAVVVVVSEEKGIISLVVGGKMTPGIDPEVLPQVLTEFLSQKKPQEMVNRFRQRAGEAAEATKKRAGSPKPKARSKATTKAKAR